MKYAIANIYTKNNDYEYNFEIIKKFYEEAKNNDVDIVIFPRLALIGFCDEALLNKEYINKSLDYLSKVIDLTENNKTKIIIGSIYYEDEKLEDGIKKQSILNDCILFIDNGYIEDILKRKNISKENILNDYKYFDPSLFINSFTLNKENFAGILSDDIYFDNNVFLIQDRKIDNLICLDSSTLSNEKILKRIELISKFLKCNIIYLNNANFYKNEYYFNGDIILINKDKKTVLNTTYSSDKLVYFEINEDLKSDEVTIINDNSSILNKYSEIENKKLIINNKYENNEVLKKLKNYQIENLKYKEYFKFYDDLNKEEKIVLKNIITKYNDKNSIYINNLE